MFCYVIPTYLLHRERTPSIIGSISGCVYQRFCAFPICLKLAFKLSSFWICGVFPRHVSMGIVTFSRTREPNILALSVKEIARGEVSVVTSHIIIIFTINIIFNSLRVSGWTYILNFELPAKHKHTQSSYIQICFGQEISFCCRFHPLLQSLFLLFSSRFLWFFSTPSRISGFNGSILKQLSEHVPKPSSCPLLNFIIDVADSFTLCNLRSCSQMTNRCFVPLNKCCKL